MTIFLLCANRSVSAEKKKSSLSIHNMLGSAKTFSEPDPNISPRVSILICGIFTEDASSYKAYLSGLLLRPVRPCGLDHDNRIG